MSDVVDKKKMRVEAQGLGLITLIVGLGILPTYGYAFGIVMVILGAIFFIFGGLP